MLRIRARLCPFAQAHQESGLYPLLFFLFAGNLNELDFTLLKTFSLGESRRLEFRGEFFNLANHPTFAAPSTSINSGSGAQVSATLNSSREVQLGAKFMF
jgi:hypothetical protein